MKFRVGCRVRQETPEEGRGTYQLKRCKYKDEESIPNTLNNKNVKIIFYVSIFSYVKLIKIIISPLYWPNECLPMARETGVQSQVESLQRFQKWYLMQPFLTLSIIYSREWSSVLPLHLGVVTIEKGAFGSPSTKVNNFTLTLYLL